jgi:hypothetical protein
MNAAGRNPLWLFALAALALWQAWMALSLFGPDNHWRNLTSDEPLLAGRHPLHLYHGWYGARSLLDRGSLCSFDPDFHAGYPKTPVFDAGSRPAELALALVGGRFCPATYKLTQFAICLLVPLAVYIGSRGLGLSRGASVLSVALAQAVWWGRPGRGALEAGDTDLLFASLAAVCQAGLLVRYHDRPGILPLLGACLAGLAGWFAHPMLMLLLAPPFLAYYLAAGQRHSAGWHIPLFACLVLALLANSFWLVDMIGFWWVRVPPDLDTPLVTRNIPSLWRAPLWGDSFDRVVGTAILLLSLFGVGRLFRDGRRPAAYLFAAATVAAFALSLAGLMSDLLGRLGASQLIVTALLFACPPSACALCWLVKGPRGRLVAATLLIGGVSAWLLGPAHLRERTGRLARPVPWEVGLGEGRLAVVEELKRRTTSEARILWEDRPPARGESRWTALLPVLTGRSFMGGLDAGAGIEHTATGLVAGRLAGRPLAEWDDEGLDRYCELYNVKWIVTWSDEAERRLLRWGCWPWTDSPTREADLGEGLTLWRLGRPGSFALVGQASCVSAGPRGILLADACPGPGGDIVLSLHYQKGMKVSPARLTLEEARRPEDNTPFVRILLKEPAGRVLITWDGR